MDKTIERIAKFMATRIEFYMREPARFLESRRQRIGKMNKYELNLPLSDAARDFYAKTARSLSTSEQVVTPADVALILLEEGLENYGAAE